MSGIIDDCRFLLMVDGDGMIYLNRKYVAIPSMINVSVFSKFSDCGRRGYVSRRVSHISFCP